MPTTAAQAMTLRNPPGDGLAGTVAARLPAANCPKLCIDEDSGDGGRPWHVEREEIFRMTINLPANLESPILAAVHSGRYASLDDAMAEAASMLVEHLKQEQEQAQAKPSSAGQQPPASRSHKPIWEVFQEISASIPEEEWAKLPVDGAEQHDHYIYGTPKRPTA